MYVKTLVTLFLLFFSPFASALIIHDQVSSQANLYQSDWGHVWDSGINTQGALSARAVQKEGNAVNFSGFDFLNITADNFVVDACDWTNDTNGNWQDYCKTDAGGTQLIDDAYIRDLYWTDDGLFRGHDVYALVGIWSASADLIDPISNTFQVGSSLKLLTPETNGPQYLFLGNNDGVFDDNLFHYDVHITAVPSPATIMLFICGLIGLMLTKRPECA